jgi:hypothetical protein
MLRASPLSISGTMVARDAGIEQAAIKSGFFPFFKEIYCKIRKIISAPT